MKTATAVISRCALRHNLQQVRRLAPHSRLIAVIKANAYGHGAPATALALKDADGYGVARLSEALVLRQEGITKPILLLEGFLSKDELPLLAENHFETVVHNIEQLFALEQTVLPHPITVWMKLDTGMHRLGIRPDLAEEFYQRLCNCRNVVQPVNIMSHLCRADEPEEETTHSQLECFDAFVQCKPGVQSITASSGILLWPQAHRGQVRPGIILYGVSPIVTQDAADFGFEPCMTLTSCLIAVREHKAGEPVGYGGDWTSTRDTCLGVVAMGYGDGYPAARLTAHLCLSMAGKYRWLAGFPWTWSRLISVPRLWIRWEIKSFLGQGTAGGTHRPSYRYRRWRVDYSPDTTHSTRIC